MIKSLLLQSFMIHHKLFLEFVPGVNVIIGDNNRGKSAILRAIRWLLENIPRSGERRFWRKKAKDPLFVEIVDMLGNTISRTTKKYTLNGIPLAAFGTDVPKPVRELFPLKEINWQRQIEPHYLILETPGNAAKIFNAATGLEEQEIFTKAIKEQLALQKTEAKRQQLNLNENQETMRKLSWIKMHMLRAKILVRKEEEFDDLVAQHSDLTTMVNLLHRINRDMLTVDVDDALTYLHEIRGLQSDFKSIMEMKSSLEYLIGELQELDELDVSGIDSALDMVWKIKASKLELHEVTQGHSQIQHIIKQIKEAQEGEYYLQNEIKKHQNALNMELKRLGKCPLCGTEMRGK